MSKNKQLILFRVKVTTFLILHFRLLAYYLNRCCPSFSFSKNGPGPMSWATSGAPSRKPPTCTPYWSQQSPIQWPKFALQWKVRESEWDWWLLKYMELIALNSERARASHLIGIHHAGLHGKHLLRTKAHTRCINMSSSNEQELPVFPSIVN